MNDHEAPSAGRLMWAIRALLPGPAIALHGIEFLRDGLPRPLDHTQPGRGHLKPGLLFGLIAREPGHPLALSGIRAIFVLLAYVVAP